MKKNIAKENFELVIQILTNKLGLIPSNFTLSTEKNAYGSCTYKLNHNFIISRIAKITQKKQGLFVALWKRNFEKKAVPYDLSDSFDLLIVNTYCDMRQGQFVFTKEVLNKKGIVSGRGSKGKNGIRVYPPWIKNLNTLATQTQKWQNNYFVEIHPHNIDIKLAYKLYL